jgi:phage terminase Nu1 subunit (DNA packaging protein)
MTKVNLLTQKEYAAHRGVSAVSVCKAVKAGRISLIDGKIDPVVADIQWQANSRARAPARPAPAQHQAAAPAPLAVPAASSQEGSGGVGAEPKPEVYWDARGRRETAEAAIAEMKEAEMRGTLIRADAVRSAWAGRITGARDALLQIPGRLAPVLAAETDLDRVVELLEAELRQALLQLSAAPAGEVAG